MWKTAIAKIVCVCVVVFTESLFAQKKFNLEFGVATGVSNYLGEIGGGEKESRPFIADMKLRKSRYNQTFFVRYRIDELFTVKAALNYLRIAGDDALSGNPGRKYRNLNFRNDIFDLETTMQWMFFNSKKPFNVYHRNKAFLTAYLFAGLGVFHHNPKALYQGQYIALQPLRTEGVAYSRWGVCLPFGAGAYITMNKKRRSHRFGIEINWRYTNTDYLDDISTVYVDPATLGSATAGKLSNRNPELTDQPDGFARNYGWWGTDQDGNPKNTAMRGNSKDKDSFLSVNITYGVSIARKTKGKIRSGL